MFASPPPPPAIDAALAAHGGAGVLFMCGNYAGEMEIGMGIHGESGVRCGPLRPADAVVDEIMDALPAEMAAAPGDRVAALVNSRGATPLMEHYILHRRVAPRLAEAGLTRHVALVGPYCTSLEMAGASITLMHLDDELATLIDHPCDCAMFQTGLK